MFLNTQYNVDIVACIDATRRMSDHIDKIKETVLSFHQMISDELECNGKEIKQCRVKIIAFRNLGIDDEPMLESRFFEVPEQYDDLKAFLDTIEAKGGTDGAANALEAIALALKSDWNPEDIKGRQVVLVFSNSSALPLDTEKNSCLEGLPRDLEQLSDWWHGVDNSCNSAYLSIKGRMAVFAPNKHPWLEMQAWGRYWQECSFYENDVDYDLQNSIHMIAVGAF